MADPHSHTGEPDKSRVRALGPPEEIPVFNCVVLIGPSEPPHAVRARVANLDGIEFFGRNEREALRQLIPAFKQRLTESRQQGVTIPWIDPPRSAEPHEQVRLIAVHL